MESLRDEEQRRVLMGFFKTAAGQYGYGDEFLGIKVPQTREVVKMAAKDMPLSEIPGLLTCQWHEVRLCGLLILYGILSEWPPSDSSTTRRQRSSETKC